LSAPLAGEEVDAGSWTQLLNSSKDGLLSAIPLERLRSLNADRNNLAHGHFHQKPFDGSYTLALQKKTRDYPMQHVLTLTPELTQIAERLRATEELYYFENLDAKDGV
jgi:hypothetical protein